MRNTVINRATVVASVLPLVLLAACDGSGAGDDGKAANSASAQPSRSRSAQPAAEPLTAAELKKAVLAKGDVDGYTVITPGKGDIAAQADVRTDQAECAPFAYALSGVTLDKPSATEQRQVTSKATKPTDASTGDLESAFDVTTTLVSLSSYADQDAAQSVIKSLTDAADACAGGFSGTAGGEKQQVTKIAKNAAPKGADEAVAFTATAVQGDSKGPMKLVVVRQGATVGYFTALNLASFVSGGGFAFPTALVTAQLDKLN